MVGGTGVSLYVVDPLSARCVARRPGAILGHGARRARE
jgi:hypothetical protein